MTNDTSRATLVTVTYNSAEVWPEFYASVTAQQPSGWKLIVIDNASTDGTVDVLRTVDHPDVEIVLNDTNVGVAAANNQGISHALEAGARRIVLVNNDTSFEPDMLAILEKSLVESGADAVSPLISFYDEPDAIWYGGGRFQRFRGIMNVHSRTAEPLSAVGVEPFETEFAPTCCLMFDRSVFERIGLMDERYFVYWDDADFAWRMKSAAMRTVVDPRTVLRHKVSVSTEGKHSDFSIRYVHRNQILFTRKYHGPLWTAYTSIMAAVAGVTRVVVSGDRPRHALLRIRAISEGLREPTWR